MDILSKFEAVTVKADIRLSEADQRFCEAHEAAYHTAQTCFQEMEYIWEDICGRQKDILLEVDSHASYLSTSGGFDISAVQISEHMMKLHSRFIQNLTAHFSRAYHVSIDEYAIEQKLLPQSVFDSRRTIAAQEQYERDMLALSLSYEDIVNLIFEQMNGRDFGEQALYELKDKCHNAAWSCLKKPRTLKLRNPFCVSHMAALIKIGIATETGRLTTA